MRRVKDHPFFGMKSDSQKSPQVELKKLRDLRGFLKGIDTTIERDPDRG
jgi:hypothetical protein